MANLYATIPILMAGSRRPKPDEPNKVVVWVTDGHGVMYGLLVSTSGDSREWAARAWLAYLKHPTLNRLVTDGTTFKLLADGRPYAVTVPELWQWIGAMGCPREQSLKYELRQLLKAAGWERA